VQTVSTISLEWRFGSVYQEKAADKLIRSLAELDIPSVYWDNKVLLADLHGHIDNQSSKHMLHLILL
jgi:hypothetical protein